MLPTLSKAPCTVTALLGHQRSREIGDPQNHSEDDDQLEVATNCDGILDPDADAVANGDGDRPQNGDSYMHGGTDVSRKHLSAQQLDLV